MALSNYLYLITLICLLRIVLFQVTNNNNLLQTIIASSKYSRYKEFTVIRHQIFLSKTNDFSLVGWGHRIHRLHLCEGVISPLGSFLDMTLNNPMMRLQPLRFRECRRPLRCHYFQIRSDPEC